MAQKYTEARKAGNRKWDAANLDRISVAAPKGTKERWKAAAAAQDKSLNQLIVGAVDNQISQDRHKDPPEAAELGTEKVVISVVRGTMCEWEDAASIAKLPFTEFVVNAVERAVDEAVSPELIEEVSLPPESLKEAREAAEAAGEGLTQFVSRAIASRASLDKRKRR